MAQKEVEQLNLLKASKMNEIVLKKQDELEEIYRGVHMDIESEAERQILMDLIDSEEESWLDEYERDQNCYSADSVHKNMKRAEKAIILDQKKLQEQNLAEKETL
ncbi:Microtubule-associated protein 65-5 [Rhynchospora pubera]|uniref:Microtubule-associated protein 65-5 n=1 Tax=Rhynchospora pubera TaxID=906938 RepID=A0AAV8GXT7_9POAL|nr:Microtubule-associated protein 65-5 [Rhynchospora pubera]